MAARLRRSPQKKRPAEAGRLDVPLAKRPTVALSEHEIAQAAFSKNRERLKAERLAREAAAPPPTKAKPKARKK